MLRTFFFTFLLPIFVLSYFSLKAKIYETVIDFQVCHSTL